MKKSIIIFITIVLVFSFANFVMAQGLKDAFNTEPNSNLGKAAGGAGYDTNEKGFDTTIANIINAALSLVGVVFLALMIYGGYLWMTARGNDQQAEKAKELIVAAVIGLVIVVGAYAISVFVVSSVGDGLLKPQS